MHTGATVFVQDLIYSQGMLPGERACLQDQLLDELRVRGQVLTVYREAFLPSYQDQVTQVLTSRQTMSQILPVSTVTAEQSRSFDAVAHCSFVLATAGDQPHSV
jgi:hypothetical protein